MLANNALANNDNLLAQSLERLSSGLKIFGHGAVSGFNCQLIHALEHFADFRHGAGFFCMPYRWKAKNPQNRKELSMRINYNVSAMLANNALRVSPSS